MNAKRILIVDDERHMRRLLQFVLQKTGATVETAGSGAEGLERLAAEKFDLLLVDLVMPEMDGFATRGAKSARCRDWSNCRWSCSPPAARSTPGSEPPISASSRSSPSRSAPWNSRPKCAAFSACEAARSFRLCGCARLGTGAAATLHGGHLSLPAALRHALRLLLHLRSQHPDGLPAAGARPFFLLRARSSGRLALCLDAAPGLAARCARRPPPRAEPGEPLGGPGGGLHRLFPALQRPFFASALPRLHRETRYLRAGRDSGRPAGHLRALEKKRPPLDALRLALGRCHERRPAHAGHRPRRAAPGLSFYLRAWTRPCTRTSRTARPRMLPSPASSNGCARSTPSLPSVTARCGSISSATTGWSTRAPPAGCWPISKNCGLRFGRDYLAVWDSTMLRLWFPGPASARAGGHGLAARAERGAHRDRGGTAEVGLLFPGWAVWRDHLPAA